MCGEGWSTHEAAATVEILAAHYRKNGFRLIACRNTRGLDVRKRLQHTTNTLICVLTDLIHMITIPRLEPHAVNWRLVLAHRDWVERGVDKLVPLSQIIVFARLVHHLQECSMSIGWMLFEAHVRDHAV